MKQSQIAFLDLLFNEGEDISVSDTKFGMHSVTRDEIESGTINLHSPPSEKHPEGFTKTITSDEIILCCINPIKGWKRDENITAFRSFLFELDDMPLAEQKKYIDDSGMPWSICIYSGNKSLHYGIILDSDLPNYTTWLGVAKWIRNIIDKADPQNISPSRGLRFPDNVRPDGLGKPQSLIEMRERITKEELWDWLTKHKDKKPKKETYTEEIDSNLPAGTISAWGLPASILDTLYKLKHGEQDFRNKSWFNMACFMAKKNISYEDAIRLFQDYYIESPDFDRKEWISSIKSGFKHIGNKGK